MIISLLTLAAGCGDPKPINVGFVSPLSGTLSDYGLSCRRGTVLAVEQLNEAGGIKGRKIHLIVKDDKNDPDEAIQADQALVDEGAVAIIGHFTSTASIAAVPEMNQKGMLLISPDATTDQLSGLDDCFLRIVAPHTALAEGMARHAYKNEGARNVALIFDVANRAYSESYIRAAETVFRQLGGTIAVEIPFDSGTDGLSAENIEQLIKAEPDMAFVAAGALDTALLAQELHKKGPNIKLFSAGWAMKRQLIENGGAAVEGMLLSSMYYFAEDKPRLNAFKQNFQTRFGEPADMAAVFGYEAVLTLKAGLEKAPTLTPEAIKQAILETGVVPGLNGDFPIDRYGDPVRTSYMYVVTNGTFQIKTRM